MNATILQSSAKPPQEPPEARRLAQPSGKLLKVFFIVLTIACGLLVLFMTMDAAPLVPSPGSRTNTGTPRAIGQINIEEATPTGEHAALPPSRSHNTAPISVDQPIPATEGKIRPQRPSKVGVAAPSSVPSEQRPRQHRELATNLPDRATSATALFSRLFPVIDADVSNEAKESLIHGQIHRSPSSALLHAEIGAIHAQRGDWPEAAHALRTAVEHDSSNPAYHRALAICLEHLRRPTEAKTHYLQSLELRGQRGLADEATEIGQRMVIDGTGPAS